MPITLMVDPRQASLMTFNRFPPYYKQSGEKKLGLDFYHIL
jgi:hypothetical protein